MTTLNKAVMNNSPEVELQQPTEKSEYVMDEVRGYVLTKMLIDVPEAMEYFELVRQRFHDKPYYNKYVVEICDQYKQERVELDGLIQRLKIVFEKHPDLLEKFNRFLPPSHRITVTH